MVELRKKDAELISLLYVSLISPHLDYAVLAWSPYLKVDIMFNGSCLVEKRIVEKTVGVEAGSVIFSDF